MFIKNPHQHRILAHGIQYLLADPEGGGGGGGEGDAEGDKTVKTDEIDRSDAAKNFFGRFSAKNNAPPEMGGSVENKPTQDQLEAARKDQERIDLQKEEDRKTAEKHRKPGSNIPQILEGKRQAEKERDEYKQKAEQFETQVKPELDKKIADLEAKINSGDFSPEKEQQFQSKIVQLEKEKQEREESLVNENSKLKEKLRFYDLQNDETFQEQFVSPVINAHKEAVKALGGDKVKIETFQRALIANSAALKASDPETRLQAESQRNQILSSLMGDLDDFAAEGFKRAAFDYIAHSQRHATALMEHEKTTQELRENARKAAEKGYAQTMESWNKAYKTTAETFDTEVKITADEIKAAKELGINLDTEIEQHNVLAQKVATGQSGMMDAIQMVHKGRVHPILKAKLAIAEKALKERDELIAKLRKSSPSGGESNGTTQQKQKAEKPSREEWQSKFTASRQKIAAE